MKYNKTYEVTVKGDGSDDNPFSADLPHGITWTLIEKPKNGKMVVTASVSDAQHLEIMTNRSTKVITDGRR